MVFDFISKEILTVVIAAMPVAELRLAIPLALWWGITPLTVYILAVMGNFLPVIPLLLFWRYLAHHLSYRFAFFRNGLEWLLERTQRKHQKKFDAFKSIALFILVAIPLPMTGAWTGTVAAFVFGVSLPRAALMIGLGILTSGAVMLLGSGLFL